ncbi:MAG: hypothetical protein IJ593_01125 [Lachnospiraceae bacterium]|nr:hypothetical protein [Lachnospiraceae bacterium]
MRKEFLLKKLVAAILLFVAFFIISSCNLKPYKDSDILCEYEDFNSLYYVKNEYKKYKYSDYIEDDVTNGEYKKSTPSITDFKNGTGILDYDIEGYVKARTDFLLKKELISKYELKMTEMVIDVRDGYFEERNAYVHYYDKTTKKDTLLYNELVSNLSYDDEMPYISFDVNETGASIMDEFKGRKILLSDIVAANSTIEGYMRVLLGTDKTRKKFFMDKEVLNDDISNENEE